MAAHRQFQALRDAGLRPHLLGAAEGLPPGDALLPHGPDEFLFPVAGMEPDRMGWADPAARDRLVRAIAGLDASVFHLHHYWRLGLDLIAALMAARPDARFVLTLHEMLGICANHGQMVRTTGRELCDAASPLRCHGCFPALPPEHFTLRRAALLATLRRFDRLIYPSAFLRRRYEAWGLDPARGMVLENYLGDELAALPRPLAPPAPGACLRFGAFGQPTAFKGLDVLVQALPLALRERPGITLTLFGCERAELEAMFPRLPIEACGPALAFAGRYAAGEAVRLMAGMGWVVVPSIWWENSPVVIQEARRAGVPLVVTGIGGMAEKVLPGVDGLHATRASPVDLARAMAEAADPATHARLSASLRDTIGRADFLAGLAAAYAPQRRAAISA